MKTMTGFMCAAVIGCTTLAFGQPSDQERAQSPAYEQIVVGPGEDLYAISMIWDVPIPELQRVNSLTGTDLVPGQKLRIPLGQNSQLQPASSVPPPAAQRPPAASPPANGPHTLITVGPGEDLYSIAMVWEISVPELQRLNGLTGTDLVPGQKLYVPAIEESAAVSPPANGPHKLITVGPGEDLYSIAMVWEISVPELQRLNGPTGTDLVRGQKLYIPVIEDGAAAAPAAPPPVRTVSRETAKVYAQARIHVVSRGEDARSVAELWAVPLEALQATNHLAGIALTPGQELIIPDVQR